ncbi:uncharacterized protein LOC110006828 [Amborella trichopoda]|uniref:uncharacterized protein LOC110006828 n=1 Tax=Amborella trichopoda TaxID=13333 RepID=UPI0009BFB30A|nr:uncharacterized protein LOC110006828 [Amborella trichopoda]|eukprot:XP_020520014.1 uncharacterized protein LOC110006828 [Amborella trichopoda]
MGIKVAQSNQGIFLSQRKYTLDILEEAGLLGAKPAAFPMEQNLKLNVNDDTALIDPSSYRRLVWHLIYLTITRLDITFSVNILSQFMQTPRQPHMDAALHILRYLTSSPGKGILLPSSNNFQLFGYSDSDWASCSTTHRSVTGLLSFSWREPCIMVHKEQSTVSCSSAKAECKAMATTTCKLVWLKPLLHDLGFAHLQPMHLYCDNQATLHIASNPVFHKP